MEDDSRNHNDQKENDSRRKQYTQGNQKKHDKVAQALKKENGLTWKEDEVVYMEGIIYVPNNKKIKKEILKENHDLVDV